MSKLSNNQIEFLKNYRDMVESEDSLLHLYNNAVLNMSPAEAKSLVLLYAEIKGGYVIKITRFMTSPDNFKYYYTLVNKKSGDHFRISDTLPTEMMGPVKQEKSLKSHLSTYIKDLSKLKNLLDNVEYHLTTNQARP